MSIVTKSSLASLDHLKDVFKNGSRGFYSRFGDGDIFIMMGKDVEKFHNFSPALQAEMIESFNIKDPSYVRGLAVNYPREKGMVRGLFAPFNTNAELEQFLVERFSINSNEVFDSAVFLHYLTVFHPNIANEFLNEFIRPKRKLFIGSIPKHRVEQLIGPIDYYVQTPPHDSYSSIDEWWPQVMRNINHVDLVIPASGIASRVINKRLWFQEVNVKSFDIGSLVDALDGKQTRKWIKLAGHRIQEVLINPPDSGIRGSLRYYKKEAYLAFYILVKSFRHNLGSDAVDS